MYDIDIFAKIHCWTSDLLSCQCCCYLERFIVASESLAIHYSVTTAAICCLLSYVIHSILLPGQ
jgi:hypothetical protein